MIVLIPRRWGVLVVRLKYDKSEKRWRGVIRTKPIPMAFTTRKFLKIGQAARWSWESNRDGEI